MKTKSYPEKYFDETGSYEIWEEETYARVIDSFASGLPKEGVICDVGCGTAAIGRRLRERGYNVVGMDLNKKFARSANRYIPSCVGDVRFLPFKSKSFNAVCCVGVLHHIPDWRDVVHGISRTLKPGGIFFGVEPNMFSPMTQLFQSYESPFSTEKEYPGCISPIRFSDVLRDAGFHSISLKYLYIKQKKTHNIFSIIFRDYYDFATHTLEPLIPKYLRDVFMYTARL